ncbi:ferritin family protein [Clostridium cellulovorans]|uniref:Rubrerythrin family protein n=1 Tax=Clostridium cellulovorans (strain ATCC 35296 / DSM 3052 / OCM 3 / 743B) TaxID=573061 RepID=D9SLS5_CLOC7|nr:ferritin-like domain-containing protein [Clostridium cellulovorans]ADL53712.1 rubrerythrin family protein [Clostridium cellulovorans 743B]
MSYTTNRQPQGILKNDETFLREGLVAEIVAINDYNHFLTFTENKEVRDIFHHIMKEEKEHYGLFLQALRTIDSEQENLSKDMAEHIKISAKHSYKDYSGGKENRSLLLTYIREAIKGEFEAIILYEDFLSNTQNKALFKLIKEVTSDEKEHVEELTRALILLDKDKYGPLI